ncbi:MAG: cupin domain-containing protein [Ardenticatenia bacterium]|jgi:oxalate decarboxylase/phosphoglucose isomerase-like protein (cupin superfamily)|nr:MAG: cupin domain-containing protein [Ardenticatenia bacterium]
MTKPALIREQDAEIVMEGGECVRIDANTGKIIFSVASLPAGKEGALDPGHQDAHEIAYLIRGRVVFEFPNSTPKWVELREGDAVFIPEGEPYKVINVGEETALISWSLAPDLGRDWLTK